MIIISKKEQLKLAMALNRIALTLPQTEFEKIKGSLYEIEEILIKGQEGRTDV